MIASNDPQQTWSLAVLAKDGLARLGMSPARIHHSGGRTVGPMSPGEGRPGAGGCGWPAGGSSSPQLVRARIWSRVATVTK
jgi:hypothetical protein